MQQNCKLNLSIAGQENDKNLPKQKNMQKVFDKYQLICYYNMRG